MSFSTTRRAAWLSAACCLAASSRAVASASLAVDRGFALRKVGQHLAGRVDDGVEALEFDEGREVCVHWLGSQCSPPSTRAPSCARSGQAFDSRRNPPTRARSPSLAPRRDGARLSTAEGVARHERAPRYRSEGARPGRVEWWAHQDSNLERAGYEPAALTIELWARGDGLTLSAYRLPPTAFRHFFRLRSSDAARGRECSLKQYAEAPKAERR